MSDGHQPNQNLKKTEEWGKEFLAFRYKNNPDRPDGNITDPRQKNQTGQYHPRKEIRVYPLSQTDSHLFAFYPSAITWAPQIIAGSYPLKRIK